MTELPVRGRGSGEESVRVASMTCRLASRSGRGSGHGRPDDPHGIVTHCSWSCNHCLPPRHTAVINPGHDGDGRVRAMTIHTRSMTWTPPVPRAAQEPARRLAALVVCPVCGWHGTLIALGERIDHPYR